MKYYHTGPGPIPDKYLALTDDHGHYPHIPETLLPTCEARQAHGGQEGRLYECFHPEVEKTTVSGLDCQDCPLAGPFDYESMTPVDGIPSPLGCPHRGRFMRSLVNPNCGCRDGSLVVYKCAKHGECTLKKIHAKVKMQSCLSCEYLPAAIEAEK